MTHTHTHAEHLTINWYDMRKQCFLAWNLITSSLTLSLFDFVSWQNVLLFFAHSKKRRKKTIIKMCRVDKIGFSKFRWLIPIFVMNVYEEFKLELAKYCDVWILKKNCCENKNILYSYLSLKMSKKGIIWFQIEMLS